MEAKTQRARPAELTAAELDAVLTDPAAEGFRMLGYTLCFIDTGEFVGGGRLLPKAVLHERKAGERPWLFAETAGWASRLIERSARAVEDVEDVELWERPEFPGWAREIWRPATD